METQIIECDFDDDFESLACAVRAEQLSVVTWHCSHAFMFPAQLLRGERLSVVEERQQKVITLTEVNCHQQKCPVVPEEPFCESCGLHS